MKWSALHSQTQRHGYLPVLAGLETEDSTKGVKVKSNINIMGQHTCSKAIVYNQSNGLS